MSNFAFLRAEWPQLFAEARRAEQNGVVDPRAGCFYARRLRRAHGGVVCMTPTSTLQKPYRNDLSARLFEPTFRALVGNKSTRNAI